MHNTCPNCGKYEDRHPIMPAGEEYSKGDGFTYQDYLYQCDACKTVFKR